MRRIIVIALVVGGVAGGVVRSGWAAEPSASSTHSSTVSTRASAAKPSLVAVQGTITTVDLASSPGQLVLSTDSGPITLLFNSKDTSIWKGRTAIQASQLRVGQLVKARYQDRGGQHLAKSIALLPAPKAAPATPSKTPQ